MKKALIAGALLAVAPLAALTAQNWDATFATTAGGHVVGNPQAATRLTVFNSYSCPHCAAFEREADAALRMVYIQPGKITLEVRPVIRNIVDVAATLAVQCGGEDSFWASHRAMLRAQPRWLEVASNLTPAQQARWNAGSLGQRMRAVAADLDFYELMAPRGLTTAELDTCLGNEARARAIVASSQADNARWNIPGTPSFAINGTMVDGVFSWADLQAPLQAATR